MIVLENKDCKISFHSEKQKLLQFTCRLGCALQRGRRPHRCGFTGGEAAAGVIRGINLARDRQGGREKEGQEGEQGMDHFESTTCHFCITFYSCCHSL